MYNTIAYPLKRMLDCSAIFCYIYCTVARTSVYRQQIYEFNPFKPSVLFMGHRQNSGEADQTPQNAVSDQALHYLLPECNFKILIKLKFTNQQPLNSIWIRSIDNG